MAHRCRTCGEAHFAAPSGISFPLPDKLLRMEPLLPELLEAAREFCSIGPGDALDFVEWLAVDIHRASASARPRAAGNG